MEIREYEKMIKEFDMKKFLHPEEGDPHVYGGWVIITDSQYVVGNNDWDGLGYHGDSIRKVLCEILEADRYSGFVTPSVSGKNYLMGTMMSGVDTAYILFPLDKVGTITPNQYKLFEKFREEYNDMIRERSKELNKRIVIVEKDGMEYATEDLEALSNILSGMIDEYKEIPKDVRILGKSFNSYQTKDEKLEEISLQMSPYQYLKQDIHSIKGVGVITDKQSIFYGVLKEKDYRTHYGISKDIEKMISNDEFAKTKDYHTYIYLLEDEVMINLPEDGSISMTQIEGVMDFITDIDRYNTEMDSNNKIPIKVMPWHGTYNRFYTKKDTIDLMDTMQEFVRDHIEEDEIIIGKELDGGDSIKHK